MSLAVTMVGTTPSRIAVAEPNFRAGLTLEHEGYPCRKFIETARDALVDAYQHSSDKAEEKDPAGTVAQLERDIRSALAGGKRSAKTTIDIDEVYAEEISRFSQSGSPEIDYHSLSKEKVQLAEATLYAYLALEKDGPQYAQLLNTAREDLAELYASAGVGKGERSATALAEKFERDTRAAIAEQKGIIELS